jgi:hypothetical protein
MKGVLDNLNPIKNIWYNLVNKVKDYTTQIKSSINLNYNFSFNGFIQFVKDYNSGKINIDDFISDNKSIIDNLNQELNEGIIKNILMLAIVFCLVQSCKKDENDIVKLNTEQQISKYPRLNQLFNFNTKSKAKLQIAEYDYSGNPYGELYNISVDILNTVLKEDTEIEILSRIYNNDTIIIDNLKSKGSKFILKINGNFNINISIKSSLVNNLIDIRSTISNVNNNIILLDSMGKQNIVHVVNLGMCVPKDIPMNQVKNNWDYHFYISSIICNNSGYNIDNYYFNAIGITND